jgi:hypothetical protein
MGKIAERIVKSPEVLLQCRIRIEVEGRPDLLCDLGDRHVFAVKFTVFVLKVMHE